MRNPFATFATALLGTALIPSLALAQLSTSHEVPYQGRLELNGVAQSGSFDMRFQLRAGVEGACVEAGGDLLWEDAFLGVSVQQGAFAVVLGSGAVLSDSVWQDDVVCLAIAVRPTGEADYVDLQGLQRIHAVPFAARADTAKDYRVTGQLQVDGAATVGGDATVEGALTLGSTDPAVLAGDGSGWLTVDGEAVPRLSLSTPYLVETPAAVNNAHNEFTETIALISTERSLCFITHASYYGDHESGSSARNSCLVENNSGTWELTAECYGQEDSCKTTCRARCLTW